MSNLSRFMKQNKATRKNEKYAPTKSLTYEDGSPLRFEFKPITTKRNEELRDSCMYDVQVTGKPNLYRAKLDSKKYLAELVVASVAYPDLYNKELQDSYGVKTPVDLLYELVDNPGEYQDLCTWVQNYQGFTETLDEKVNDAKN